MADETDFSEVVNRFTRNEQVALLVVLNRHQAGECTLQEALEEFRAFVEKERAA